MGTIDLKKLQDLLTGQLGNECRENTTRETTHVCCRCNVVVMSLNELSTVLASVSSQTDFYRLKHESFSSTTSSTTSFTTSSTTVALTVTK